MVESRPAVVVLVAVIGTLAALLTVAGAARADHQPSNAVVTITDSPDPAGAGGSIVYTIAGKNDGTVRAMEARLEAEIPGGATFSACRTSVAGVLCEVAGSLVTAPFASVAAHAIVRMFLTVRAPDVTVDTTITLRAKFSGDNMHMDERLHSTLVLPVTTRLLMLPSQRIVRVTCGDTIDAGTFGADTAAQLLDGLVCDNGSGLTMRASGRTLSLGGKKIFSSRRVTGNAGIIVGPDTTDVTIDGAGTQGTKGVEQFEYCVKDLGGNTGLHITALRCFRAKSVGILALSDGVLIANSLIDNTRADGSIEGPAGGIGIEAGGDNVRVKDTVVRRSGTVGFWAHGTDTDGSGSAATYDGNTLGSRIEDNFGVGVLFSQGPHTIKGTKVQGDDFETGTSTDGIVIAPDARGALVDEVVIKSHRGHAVRVDAGATGTLVRRTSVEQIGGSGYLIDAPATLNGNSATMVEGDAFVVNASATLTTNSAEMCSGHAFVISAAAVVDGNSAIDCGGHGFVVTHSSSGTTAVTGPTFADVPPDHIFFEFIEALSAAGITSGCATDPARYCPDAPVNRGQMAVFLLRGINGAGAIPPAPTGAVYADVPVDHPFAAWIEQLASAGITGGCATSPPQYCPGATVTRGQMAVFLLRAKYGSGYQPPGATGMFADVPPGHVFAGWVEQLAREGITGGCGTNPARYCPDSPVTRGQMAVLLARAIDLSVSGGARLRTNSAEGNAAGGFLVSGSGNVLDGNDARSNNGPGFDITGSGNVLDTNAAERSEGPEFAIAPDNVDDGGNRANGTRFSFTASGGAFE
jgi:parallel beta-helix repeat protein